ncbi:XdhC family protein [Cognatishimia activa]|uniref:Xanthine dehydrogenase accessory protein XdhC n=1 Tax=Cognatishimia activa TaxID=1715691 RepID=A0A0P1IZA8_9RHOB|nr:XdhC family protein [Cognatishimia activa]CUI61861.1 xanthine dehydrogenase accessory protein XdhC [Cognatishimia activa]CUK26313.1 xanthine dehydrogenase accessory protein XdhC [Cognatishimia activa]
MNRIIPAIAQAERLCAVAIIVGQEGPAYRPLGAMMAVYEDGSFEGHLSSGCIEADIISHCQDLSETKIITYGAGSQFVDLKLPCGGAMDVLMIPTPPQEPFQAVEHALSNRQPAALAINLTTGNIALSDASETSVANDHINLFFEPPLQLCVFGNGHEAKVFSELANGAGHGVKLFSTSPDTLERCAIPQSAQHLMTQPKITDLSAIDDRTAIVLFFHDHDLEEQILIDALKTDAFYIGAQGSMRTQQRRLADLEAQNISGIDRIRGPIGLIPRTRDAQTLAISVLAEIHAVAGEAAK